MNRFRVDGDRLVVYGHVLGEIEGPVCIIRKSGEYFGKPDDRQSEVSKETLRLSQYRNACGFLPLAVSIDNGGRYALDGMRMRKGDLVVVVGRGRDPLILRRLENSEGLGGGSRKENTKAPVYQLIATADIPDYGEIQKKIVLDDVKWDVKETIIR